ncbi:helix-turn-helix transcriptional regulator [Longispora fulva]|uniref:DNA-binding CsgD family transcriptional regulator n=1 Tax=Longispora fulva TaxID=619741 RepID=A0A8J7KL46_9ACTN|nr:helix-turn-helix transcriptional regulator [Longispora fulva]MBG6138889.1 DNA-binding CsgD family transcriptional regulator [Longispora fulva]
MIGVLSRSLGLPANRVRIALDELNSVGAARPERTASPTGPVQIWRGRRPDAVVTSLRDRELQAAQARHLLRRQLTGLDLADIMNHPDMSAPQAVVTLNGWRQVQARLGELTPRTRQEALAIMPEAVLDAQTVRAGADNDRDLARRGILARRIGVPSGVGDASRALHAEMAAHSFNHYRQVAHLPARIIIMDRRTAILPIDPARVSRGALEVTAPAAVARLVELFHTYWDKALPPEQPMSPDIVLTPREAAIIALLTEGHTDASVSAELGISVRTIAYSISDLMSRCGVQNRFQLGLVLGSQTITPRTTEKEPEQ